VKSDTGIYEYTRMMISKGKDFNNSIQSSKLMQIVFLRPQKDSTSKDEILPYSEYKLNNNIDDFDPLSERSKSQLEPKIAVAFTGLPTLMHLKISGCRMYDISWDIFYKLNNLKFLCLENNNLLFLPEFVFYAAPNISSLSLSHNRILNLQTVGLAGLFRMKTLDMSHNNLTHLSELSLPPFPHLEAADFRDNPIEAIFPNTFEVMNTTKVLLIGSTKTPLQFFPNSFNGLLSLIKLHITNAKIDFLERPMLRGMPQLETLEITGQITRISYDAFSEISKVQRLILHHCSMKKISMDAFYGLNSLLELDLSYNKLTSLPPGLFDDQLSLREIYLQHNQLTTCSEKLFLHLPAKLIRLDKNPWHCTCEMKHWDYNTINRIKRYHIKLNETFCQNRYDKGLMCSEQKDPEFFPHYVYEARVSPICSTPEAYMGRSVFDVVRKDLKHCLKNDKTMQKIRKMAKSSEMETNLTKNSLFLHRIARNRQQPKPVKTKKRQINNLHLLRNHNRDRKNQTVFEFPKQSNRNKKNKTSILGSMQTMSNVVSIFRGSNNAQKRPQISSKAMKLALGNL